MNISRQINLSRRQFLSQAAMGAGAAIILGPFSAIASAAQPASTSKMIGIQISAISFVDEGV